MCVFVWVYLMRTWFSLREIVSKHFGCYQDDVVCVKWITFSMNCCLDDFAQPNERCRIHLMQKISGELTHILRTWKKIKTLEWINKPNSDRYPSRNMNMNECPGQRRRKKSIEMMLQEVFDWLFFPSPCILGHPMDTFIVINERESTSAQQLLFFFTIWPEN